MTHANESPREESVRIEQAKQMRLQMDHLLAGCPLGLALAVLTWPLRLLGLL